MDKNIKQNIIIGLLILNLFGVFVILKNSNEEVWNEIYNMNSNMNQLNNQLSVMDSSIRREIEQMQEEAQNYVSSFDFSYNKLNKELLTMNTEVSVVLKENHVGSDVFLIAKDENGTTEKTLLAQSDGLNYGTTVNLDLDKNYSFNIVEVFEGNMKQLNYEEYSINLKRDYYQRRVELDQSSSGSDNKSMYFSQQFTVNNFGIEDFEVKDISFVISKDGVIIYNEKATEGLFNMKDLTDKQRLMVASGELLIERPSSMGTSSQSEVAISEEKSESVPQKLVMDDNKKDTFIFQKVIVYDDYPEYDFNQDDRLDSYLVVTFMDGSEIEVGRY